jgi:hypothetical protein
MKTAILASLLVLLLPLLISMRAQAVTRVTVENAKAMNLMSAAAYCRGLIAGCEYLSDGSKCNSDSYGGWRLPTADELTEFVGLSTSENYYWTTTPYHGELNTYIVLSLLDGSWGYGGYSTETQVRCVQ